MKKDFNLYVGSLWHQGCDPFVYAVGTTKTNVKAALDMAAEDEYTYMCDGLDETEAPVYDIMTSPYGPTLESVRGLLNELPEGERYRLREALEVGYSYLPI